MGPHIVRNEGPLGLFKGVDASAARQLVYSGVAWLEHVFFSFCMFRFFFHFGSFGIDFFIAIFRRFWKVISRLKPEAPVGGALRNVRHAEGRSCRHEKWFQKDSILQCLFWYSITPHKEPWETSKALTKHSETSKIFLEMS